MRRWLGERLRSERPGFEDQASKGFEAKDQRKRKMARFASPQDAASSASSNPLLAGLNSAPEDGVLARSSGVRISAVDSTMVRITQELHRFRLMVRISAVDSASGQGLKAAELAAACRRRQRILRVSTVSELPLLCFSSPPSSLIPTKLS